MIDEDEVLLFLMLVGIDIDDDDNDDEGLVRGVVMTSGGVDIESRGVNAPLLEKEEEDEKDPKG